LQLDGPNSFTGGVIFNTGTVSVGSDTALGTGKFDMPTVAPVYIKSSTSDARIIPNELGMGSGGFTTIGDGNLTFTGLISSYNGTKTYTISNPVTVLASYLTNHAGGSIKNGPGTFIMTASNLNSGGVTVNQGVLGIGHSNTLGTGTLTMNGGALMTTIAGLSNWNNNIQVWNTNFSFVGTNDLYLGTGAVTVNYAVTLTNNTTNTLVVGGSISGTGTLAKTGTGLVVLSGTTNALTNVAISGGTLEIDNPGLSSQCTLSIASGATLKLGFFASGVSCTVSELYLGGVKQAAGVYDSTTSPTYITGTGRIQVTPYVYIPTGSYQLTNSFNITTSTLTLSWQGGQNWKLQAQTNDLATGITNNWSDVVTDTTVSNYSIAVYPTNPTVFYRLYWQQ
jgi:autotransporter-associated beta strand protein